MIYADEQFYKEKYLAGRTPVIDMAFAYYIRQAGMELDRYIAGKDVIEYKETVGLCCCEVAESFYRYEKTVNSPAGAPLVSYSNDGQSGTYDMSRFTTEGHRKEIKDIIYRYLDATGLLFQGVCG